METHRVNPELRSSIAYQAPSDTYVKAWYKLKELEVVLCSARLTTDQVRTA